MASIIPVCEPLLAGNETKYVLDAVSTGWISSSGSYVARFEKEFSKYCDSIYGVSVCNGTVALHLALAALGIGKGDEVIIPSFTMIATAFAVCYTGAIPVFVDADKDTWNIDVSLIESKITTKTKAIIPVHIFGNPCDMDAIMLLAKKYGLYIVEDAAEAHGATYDNKKVGSFSDIACFSFFANKIITTGEGGMCVMRDEKLYDKCRYYKNVCFNPNGNRDYRHEDIGFNYRMSNIHAAIGLAQTEKADDYKQMRIRNHSLYKEYLCGVSGIVFQQTTQRAESVEWMNAIVVEKEKYGHDKEELIAHLRDNGIETRKLFVSMSRQESLKKFGCDCSGEYPVADRLSDNGLYLPSGSGLDAGHIKLICDVIKGYSK